ncbi:ribosome silencing factor [Microcoleus sp. FACHB-53]|jgi:ribosome-associated protein|nr:ribosome silencing factor [Microcoleus sp. FACHB-53]MBD2129630.1 ribosome silencing factor [Microcoleus sp. FACHB-1]
MRDQLKMPSTLVSTSTQTQDMSKGLALTIAEAADDRKAGDIVILRVAEVSYLADFFVIVTGYSRAQVRAISQAIEQKVEMEWERRSLRTEGVAESSWILQDYGEVIVHILLPQEREFYNLEAFWGHAEQIEFQVSQPQQ